MTNAREGYLVPEKRSDRNGNIVTRWVRAARARRGSKASIPFPELDEATRKKLAEQKAFREEVDSVLFLPEKDNAKRYDENTSFVINHEPALVKQVLDACSDPFKKDFWAQQFNTYHLVPIVGQWDGESPPDELIQEKLSRIRQSLITTDEAVELFTDEDRDHDYCKRGGLYYLDSVGRRLASGDPSEERLRAGTLIGYLSNVHIGHIFCDSLKVPDQKVDFFTENYYQIKPFIPQLRERASTDVSFITGLLSGVTPVLADGAL